MKKSGFVICICAVLILLCTVFVSCKGKEDAPTIKLTYNGVVKNNGNEVDAKVGEEATIIIEYNAPGSIRQILLSIGSYDQISVGDIINSGFDSKTTHKITRTIKFEELDDIQIKTSIEDKQKKMLLADFEMRIKVN